MTNIATATSVSTSANTATAPIIKFPNGSSNTSTHTAGSPTNTSPTTTHIHPHPHAHAHAHSTNSTRHNTTNTTTNTSRPSTPPPMKLRSLPIIDISPWVHPESEKHRGHNGGRRSTAAALHAACLTYGFFYLDVGSLVEEGEMEVLAGLAKEFFDLPQEEKDKLGLSNQDGARGYQRLKENITNGKADNHEGLDFYAPVSKPDKTKPLQGENQWPSDDVVPGFRAKYEAWVEKMKKLGMIVMEAMSVGLGMSKGEWEELKSKVDDSFWVMRVIGYPPLPNDYDGFSCGTHKDYGCLTFLYADPTPNALQVFMPQTGVLEDAATTPIPASGGSGLAPSAASAYMKSVEVSAVATRPSASQVVHSLRDDPIALDDEGGEKGVWINADPIPGCVVCNVGEMWEVWTNGLYKSTLHRVIHQGSNYRVSIPFFFEPNFDAHIAPLPAALRLQKDSIQPAYAYTPTHPHVHYSHCHHEPADLLTQRLKELVVNKEGLAVPHSGSSDSSSAVSLKDYEENESTRATNGTSSARSSMSFPELRTPQSPLTPHHAHAVYTPLSVEKRYESVVYGEFLLKKVANNFTDGKGKYD